MRVIVLWALCCAAVAAAPRNLPRIVGGNLTTIDKYPSMAVILRTNDYIHYGHNCGGTIINNRSVLTAAHCIDTCIVEGNRVRLGSSYANSGGEVLMIAAAIAHPDHDYTVSYDYDIAVLRTSVIIEYKDNISPAPIAGSNYNLADDEVVWAAGWGITELGSLSEQLRDVQVWTINQEICRARYGAINGTDIITPNMLCTGWLDVGIRDQCDGDSGGPVFHRGVLVGVCSFGGACGDPVYPGVNVRVSSFTPWIQANA